MGLKRPARYKVLPFAAVAIAYLPAIAFIGIVAFLPSGRIASVRPGSRPGPLLRVHHGRHHPVRGAGRPGGPVPRQAVPLSRRLSVLAAQPLDLPAGQGHRRGRRAPAGHAGPAPAAADRPGPARTRGLAASPPSWARWPRSWAPGSSLSLMFGAISLAIPSLTDRRALASAGIAACSSSDRAPSPAWSSSASAAPRTCWRWRSTACRSSWPCASSRCAVCPQAPSGPGAGRPARRCRPAVVVTASIAVTVVAAAVTWWRVVGTEVTK